jgi:transcriptional regulator with AAA-type ATPase domain
MDQLVRHNWPGNIRELRAVIESGFAEARSDLIASLAVASEPIYTPREEPFTRGETAQLPYERRNFWRDVYTPFLKRELNRDQVRAIVRRGLEESSGNYRLFLGRNGVSRQEYLKAMDFLRHHDLKPTPYRARSRTSMRSHPLGAEAPA